MCSREGTLHFCNFILSFPLFAVAQYIHHAIPLIARHPSVCVLSCVCILRQTGVYRVGVCARPGAAETVREPACRAALRTQLLTQHGHTVQQEVHQLLVDAQHAGGGRRQHTRGGGREETRVQYDYIFQAIKEEQKKNRRTEEEQKSRRAEEQKNRRTEEEQKKNRTI